MMPADFDARSAGRAPLHVDVTVRGHGHYGLIEPAS